MELLGMLVIAAFAYLIIRNHQKDQIIAAQAAALEKREKRKESKVARLRDQNQNLDNLLAEKETELLDVKFKLYSLTKDTITISRHAPLDVDKLANILHDVEHSGMSGLPDNVNGLLTWLHGKERNKWPDTLMYHNVGYHMVVWQGRIGHAAPYGLQQVIANLEQFHNQKVSANGHQ